MIRYTSVYGHALVWGLWGLFLSIITGQMARGASVRDVCRQCNAQTDLDPSMWRENWNLHRNIWCTISVAFLQLYNMVCPPVSQSHMSWNREIGPFEAKQGRIHGRISRVRLGRSSDAKTARKTPKKQMRCWPTDGPTNRPTNQPTDQPTDRHSGV